MPVSSNGLENLRKFGEQIQMTEEQLGEYVKCMNDIFYFIENYVEVDKIGLDNNDAAKGGTQTVGKVKLFDYQKRILKTMCGDELAGGEPTSPGVIALATRGSGKTTLSVFYFLWYMLFNENKNCAFMSNTGENASGVMSRFRNCYIGLPKWLQQGVKVWTKGIVELENGCYISAQTTTVNSGRSKSLSRVLLDEFAIIPEHVANEFYASVYPTLTRFADSKVFIMTTLKKTSLTFVKMFNDAKAGKNGLRPIQVNWWEFPGRGPEWKAKQIAILGEENFNREYANEISGKSSTLIKGEHIFAMKPKQPVRYLYDKNMKIYEEPIPDSEQVECKIQYCMGVDTAYGTSENYSVIQVLKIQDKKKIEMVATYASNTISPSDFEDVIIFISKMYDAWIIIERTGVGMQVAQDIWFKKQYDMIVNTEKQGIGTIATNAVKLKNLMVMKELIEVGALDVIDEETIKEFSAYEETTLGKFKAIKGYTDDRVSALQWACMFLTTEHCFYDLEEIKESVMEEWKKRKKYSTSKMNLDKKEIQNNPNYEPIIEEEEELEYVQDWKHSSEEERLRRIEKIEKPNKNPEEESFIQPGYYQELVTPRDIHIQNIQKRFGAMVSSFKT